MDEIYEKLEEILKAMVELKELLDIKKKEMDSLFRKARYCMDAESCRLKLGAVRQELTNARNENSALKTQLVLYSENFQAEQRDRERAQEKLSNVESELIIAKREVSGRITFRFAFMAKKLLPFRRLMPFFNGSI